MDIAEIIFNEYTKENLKTKENSEFLSKEKAFIDKLSVADAREYYEIIETLANKNGQEQLQLIKYVIKLYSRLLTGKV